MGVGDVTTAGAGGFGAGCWTTVEVVDVESICRSPGRTVDFGGVDWIVLGTEAVRVSVSVLGVRTSGWAFGRTRSRFGAFGAGVAGSEAELVGAFSLLAVAWAVRIWVAAQDDEKPAGRPLPVVWLSSGSRGEMVEGRAVVAATDVARFVWFWLESKPGMVLGGLVKAVRVSGTGGSGSGDVESNGGGVRVPLVCPMPLADAGAFTVGVAATVAVLRLSRAGRVLVTGARGTAEPVADAGAFTVGVAAAIVGLELSRAGSVLATGATGTAELVVLTTGVVVRLPIGKGTLLVGTGKGLGSVAVTTGDPEWLPSMGEALAGGLVEVILGSAVPGVGTVARRAGGVVLVGRLSWDSGAGVLCTSVAAGGSGAPTGEVVLVPQ